MTRESSYDCVVIGAGPAGCAAATLIAERGHSTLLLEREKLPRFHVGESLMPETFWALERLGVLPQLRTSSFIKKVGVQFVSPSGTESQPFFFAEHDPRPCSQTWHVERAAFDQILFENARTKGATCLDNTRVLDVRLAPSSPHEVTMKTADGLVSSLHARVVVDATGQQALLANRLGLRVMNPQLKKVAIWGHFRNARRSARDDAEVTAILHTTGKRAWFWYIPLTENKVSIGLVGDASQLLRQDQTPDAVFDEYVGECPALSERLTAAEPVSPLQVVREFSYSTRQHAGDGWVLVGDAFGFIDPVYSTGVLLALRSGELAADAIHDGLELGDLSPQQLGKWTDDFERGVERFRSLVTAFYTNAFSFAEFLRQYPDHRGALVDLLIGRGFQDSAQPLVEDLEGSVKDAMAAADA